MSDHDGDVSEVEKLAGEINASIESFNETASCLFQGCWWSGLGCLGFGIVGTLIGGSFNFLESEIGFWPTMILFILGGCLAIHLYLRHKGGGGGASA